MKKVWEIFRHDLKKIFTNPVAVIVLIGIMIIPALYAWFNIYSNWDPYSATSGIKVAVANMDEGATIEGLNVNVGDMIVDKLATNDAIGWEFMSEEDALEGTRSGAYYAAIVIPEDFSSKILSIAKLTVEKPEIEYYVNEKKNAIAPKITNTGVNTVQLQINEAFVETVSSVVSNVLISASDSIVGDEQSAIDAVLEDLQNVRNNLNEYRTLLDVVNNSSQSLNSALDATRNLLPAATSALDDASQLGTDSKNLAASAVDTLNQMNSSIAQANSVAQTEISSLDSSLTDALGTVGSDTEKAAVAFDELGTKVQNIRSQVSNIQTILENIQSRLTVKPDALQSQIDRLSVQIEKLDSLSELISNSAATIRKTGKLPDETRTELKTQMAAIKTAAGEITSVFNSETKPALETAYNDLSTGLDSLSSLMSSLSATAPTLDSALGSMSDSLGYASNALSGTQALMDSAISKIDSFIEQIQNAKDGEKLKQLIELVTRDPDVVSSFMAEPVEVETIEMYPISNYGSGMAPFYTTLCLWVGALINVAIMKCHISDPEAFGDLTPDQAYFGRYMIFMFTGIFQALIVCIGDIWFLKIQCLYPFHFILAGVLTSIVYTLIVYTLTCSFGDVGKAIAVVLLVIQVAGSGGTFPIETLPSFYQALYPWMPFNYAINAMRECVAGMFANDYWIYMLKEFCFTSFALLIGMVLRKPIIRLNHYFEKKLQDTGIMG